jgi:hypothetical protein
MVEPSSSGLVESILWQGIRIQVGGEGDSS